MSFNLHFLIQILCVVVICGQQNVTKPSEEQNVTDTTGQQNVPEPIACPVGWSLFEHQCFKVYLEKISPHAAHEKCKALELKGSFQN